MRIYTKESLEILRNKIDLIEVISPFVNLKRSGASYKGLCPFHEEKTPSFIVQKGDYHYHCFGCGAHGDAIEFLMSYQKMSFVDAIEHLAERFHVKLEQNEEGKTYISNKSLLKEALFEALNFYHFNLLHTKEGHLALSYLYERGIDLDFIKTFQIGYAPFQFGVFAKYMREKNFSLSILEQAGLLKKFNNNYKEFFLDRIMIPIKDPMGNIIGFSSRKFKEKTFGPKYINTPETLLFKKSKVLFGLSFCRKKIAKERRAIIVEGQFDALRAIYDGISITVAGQGTAFGESHIKELIKLGVNKVYLALDGDKAGKEATLKIGHLFQKKAIEVYCVNIPDKKDPDSFLKEQGPETFLNLVEKSQDYLSFLIKYFSNIFDTSSPAGKSEMINVIVKRINDWDHPLMAYESLKKLATLTNTPQHIIGVDDNNTPNVYIRKNEKISQERVNSDRVLEADFFRWLLLVSDSGPRFIEIAKKNISIEHFKLKICQKLYDKYLKASKESKSIDLLSLAIDLDDTEEQLFLSEILQRKINRDKAEEGFLKTVQNLLDRKWMEERENIKIKIQSGNLSEKELLLLAKKFDEIKNKRPSIIHN